MNKKIVTLFLLVLLGAQPSFAKPQYLVSFNEVYSDGTCDTCHIQGSSDGPFTSYGILFQSQPDHQADPKAALIAIKSPAATPGFTPTPGSTATTTPTPAASTSGIVSFLGGLIVCFHLLKRHHK